MNALRLALALFGFALGLALRGYDETDIAMIIGAAFGMAVAELTRWVWK